MELIFVLMAIAVVLAPPVLSIMALIRANRAEREVESLRRQLARLQAAPHQPSPPSPQMEVSTAAPAAVHAPTPALPVPPPATPVPAMAPPPVQKPPPLPPVRPEAKPILTEVAFGGRIASFAGVGLLLIGLALLVGYAIRNAWMGPAVRVLMGLLSGAALVVIGHVAEVRGKGRYAVLARSLTGGGTALFYFTVFSAYAFYGLIGQVAAMAGLVVSAAAALGLAVVYRSQVVGLIGVIGACVMPLLLAGRSPNPVFALTYLALINVPVLVLGLKRNWQALYNTAFGFTGFYLAGFVVGYGEERGGMALLFGSVFFLQFATLGLVKLRAERPDAVRTTDIVRLVLNSLGWLGVLMTVLPMMDRASWRGAALLGGAVVHLALARVGWQWFPRFSHDLLALLFGALTMASLALPAQLDGAWVSVGWSIEGVLLCWLALRARVGLLQVAAVLLGLIGLGKAMGFDVQFYTTTPDAFLNARFISGLLAALLLGAQGVLHRRHAQVGVGHDELDGWRFLAPLAALAVVSVVGADLFWTLGDDHFWSWLGTGSVLVAVALLHAAVFREALLVRGLLVLALAGVLVLAGVWWELADGLHRIGINLPFLVMIGLAVALFVLSPRCLGEQGGPEEFSSKLQLGSVFAVVWLVTVELYRLPGHWDQVLVTIWWAVSAITLVLYGLMRQRKKSRYGGLLLFGAMTVKVLLVDLSALSGLERIIAFIGAGVLLLVLSFVYQRAAERLSAEEAA
ncbi:MAG TPA: DUF2339 domain-containing protein [Kiritimatiellia bacterium]|nr:DUF2339 domain-containing protein [Kiritimatiellia bacterium]HMP34527.1 DUF2339 domain-containing protein [Kiritimatiellia bacterium]